MISKLVFKLVNSLVFFVDMMEYRPTIDHRIHQHYQVIPSQCMLMGFLNEHSLGMHTLLRAHVKIW